MAGRQGPVGKLSRRLGVGITPKGEKILARRSYPPGQHGQGGRPRKLSVYGLQLLEKQKAKAFYGLRETQFRRLFAQAERLTGPTGDNLLSLLERRLDNVVYRLGLAVTRAQARQLVNHGHFAVNGTPTDIPSFCVRAGDTVSIRPRSQQLAYFKELFGGRSLAQWPTAQWLTPTEESYAWKVATLPQATDAEPSINVQIVVEFYSR